MGLPVARRFPSLLTRPPLAGAGGYSPMTAAVILATIRKLK